MKTESVREIDVQREWFVVDAQDLVLGRISTRIATVLMGKHKPTFTPHVDTGDFVVVLNCEKIKLTGRKLEQKIYYRHTGYAGGIKQITAEKLLASAHSDRVVHNAIKGMLPKNSLGRQMLTKLKVYAGPNHPHAAQSPEEMPLG